VRRPAPSFRFAGLALDTTRVACWQTVRIGGQALWVILLARLLGPHGYGAFAGASGLATALGGLTGLGMGLVMLQDVSRDPTLFGDRWHKALTTSLVSGALLTPLYVICGFFMLRHTVPLNALVAIGLSELLLFPVMSVCAFAFSSRHRMGTAAALPAVMASFRMLALLAFWIAPLSRSLPLYAWYHAGATLACAAAAWLWVTLALRPAAGIHRPNRRDLCEGLGFSMVWMVGNALSSLDKTLVLRIAGAETAGLYTAGYRFATVFALPVEALTMAAGPRLFRHGGGMEKQPHLVPRLFLSTLFCTLAAGGALWGMSGVLPWLLGPAFTPAVPAVRGMAAFVPCYGLRLLGSNVLMAADGKRLRAIIEGLGLALLITLAFDWLPAYGLSGAIAMICTTEACLATITWLVVWVRRIHH